MTQSIHRFAWLRSLLLACTLLACLPAQAGCVAGACISAGPRLASVDSTQGALLNPLLGGLLGSSLNLSVADWNTLAQGDVRLLDFLTALKVSANVSSPVQALGATVTLGQVAAALNVAAQAQAKTSLSGALQAIAAPLAGSGATVRVGDLLKLTADTGALGGSTVNALDMLTGLIQLYNHRNVLTTPQPVGISGGVLGMLGVLNSVQLYAQMVEPPVYVCGPAGTQFHTAALRLKLKLDLVTLSPVTDLLMALPGITNARLGIARLDVYAEVARGEGSLAAVEALTRSVTLQVSPGVADLYIGSIPDSVFFNRSRVLNPDTDLDYGTIGALELNELKVGLEVKSSTRGDAPFANTVVLSGAFPQSRTVGSSALFASNLVSRLVGNLSLRTTPNLGVLDVLVLPVLKLVVGGVLAPVLSPVLTGVADPLLHLLGIGLGEMTVTVHGICQACDDFRLTKVADKANATPGATIAYEVAYENAGSVTLSNLVLSDTTPPFTVFAGAECGAMPLGLGSCAIAAQPAVGASGKVEWRFSGSLQPGARGSVRMRVKVQ